MEAGWHPVNEATPLGVWLETKHESEKGTNRCFARVAPGDGPKDFEWIDKSGRTTVTHGTFLAPTHWRLP